MYHEKFTTAELENKIEEIMDRFDFKKVLEHMEETKWCWQMTSGYKVPDMDQIRSTARRLLTNAVWNDESVANVSTGGFHAYKLPWGLELTFSLTWSYS